MGDTQNHANGIQNGVEEEEEDLTRLRPADINADVKEMERRKRVEMIMNSKLFREELERIIEMQIKDGNGPAGLLQQISDMMGIQAGKLHTTQMFRGSNCVTPINDIRGVESMAYEKGEKHLRCKLASVFRLMDLYGWSQGIHNQITVRLNQDEEHFLVNPYGMLYNEITASSLVKVDMQGNVVEPGTTNFSVHTQVFLLHSSIHASRPDIKCIIHIHTPSVLAVSSLKCGLLPLCQEALVIGEVSQHPFVSGIFEPEEREKIIRNLGPTNKILLLHNHGALCCGETVEEAFYNVYNTVLACETQIKLMPIGVENLVLVNDEMRKQVYDAAHRAPEVEGDKKVKNFRVGELEFEALIRMLDNAGFRTGYIYRHPLVKGEVPKPKNDVEVPPAVSSLGYLIEEEKLYKQGNWKKYVDGRNRLDRTKWLNSPNVYQKVEILETGTSDPKKITKWVDQNSEEWVAENSPTHSSTPVKIDSALQFVPKNTNPKEFKKLQQQIKENRLADKITSGPQSHILEGVTWEEAKKLQDANITQTGDQVILVGAASKGIIQRNFQHNALVYKTPYAKNPFDSISDKEIEDYKRLIERKQRGDTDYEESQSESEAVSSRQEALRHIKSPLMSPQSATSETEEESRDEPRVLRIETKTAPQPIQAEVVLSDAEFDTTDARVERSQSARYPKAEKPESVTIVNSFRKSWSLKRDKDKNKDSDIPDVCISRVMESSLILTNFNKQQEEPLHSCIARMTNLKHKPLLVNVGMVLDGVMYKSASDPCNLSRLSDSENSEMALSDCRLESWNSNSDSNLDLKRRLSLRKKLIYSAKMKFLGFHDTESCSRQGDSSPGSHVRALISEIRAKISDVMSPERDAQNGESSFKSLGWIEKQKLVQKSLNSQDAVEEGGDWKSGFRSYGFASDPTVFLRSYVNEEERIRNEVADVETACSQGDNYGETTHMANLSPSRNNVDKSNAYDFKPLMMEVSERVDATDETTYTITTDNNVRTCSSTESTETEWYYNKTILKPNNSQTVLEFMDKKCDNRNFAKQSDTGIETDFTSERDNEKSSQNSTLDAKMSEKQDEGENSMLNKSSETDSSLLRSNEGRTSTDIDTSSAFKTETENSEKVMERDYERGGSSDLKKIQDSVKLPGISESPEFTNVDTEDAPVTSSSKGSSPEVGNEGIVDSNETGQEAMGERKSLKKKRRGKKRSTKITVKKEVSEKDSKEPVVSEIKLTITNRSSFAEESYLVEIQDDANTSEEMSRTASSFGESFENCEIIEGNCDCPAQQNLETLQSEVNNTIEKLHDIEDYFEDEIRKSAIETTCGRNSSQEELLLTYNEGEEVLAGDAGMVRAETHMKEDSITANFSAVINGEENFLSENMNITEHEGDVPEIACYVETVTENDATVEEVCLSGGLDSSGNISSDTKVCIDDLIDFNKLLDEVIIYSETSKFKSCGDINDVMKFIIHDEESLTNSLAEIEDIDNVISVSESLITEANDSTEGEQEVDGEERSKIKKKSVSTTFSVLIATPTRKEIFINYDEKDSSTFSLVPEPGEKGNSYINIDDVNEDFVDSPEWFSPGKISGNTSFDSAMSNPEDSSNSVCSCIDYNDLPLSKKSPGSLTIIEEVEEVEGPFLS